MSGRETCVVCSDFVCMSLGHTIEAKQNIEIRLNFYEPFRPFVVRAEASCGFNHRLLLAIYRPHLFEVVNLWIGWFNAQKSSILDFYWFVFVFSFSSTRLCLSHALRSALHSRTAQNDQNRCCVCVRIWDHMMCAANSMATITHFRVVCFCCRCCCSPTLYGCTLLATRKSA